MKSFDANTEMQVIKTICDSPSRMSILSKISAEYFGSDSALEIYNRVMALITAGKPAPSSDVLRNDEALTEPSRALISNSTTKLLSSEDDTESALAILTKYRKARLLLRSITGAIEVLRANDPDIDAVIEDIGSVVQRCHSGSNRDEMDHYSALHKEDLLREINADLTSMPEGFIPTGFAEFDKKTGGFRKKNVIVLASVPGGGKTAMAQQMAIYQYMMGYNVCIVSYEMDKTELRYRLLSNVSKVDLGSINLKRLTKKQIDLINKKFEEFIGTSKNRFTIWPPQKELNLSEISMQLKPLNYDIIYIDYIGLLKQDEKKQLWENLGAHSRVAKLSAGSLDCAMVLLAQLDEDNTEKIKYAKAIKANADIIWTWENTQKEKESGIIEIRQLKSRNSNTYNFLLFRDFSTMTFKDYNGPPPVKDDDRKDHKDAPRMDELK